MGPSPEHLIGRKPYTFHSPQVQRSSLEETMAELAKARIEIENSQIQMAKLSLEETMVELRRSQVEFAMVEAENEISMAELNYVHKALPRFYAQNEISPLPQENMTNLEATMAEWRRAQAEFATSQAQFMEKVNQPPQEDLILENKVDELAISMVELAKSRTELFMQETKADVQFQCIPLNSLEETMIPKAISYSQSTIKKEQPLKEKGISVQELVAKYMNEGENMVETSFKGQ